MKKVLVIRFSSFGDIVQCLSCIPALKFEYPNSDIHFLTKSSFSKVASLSPDIDKLISFDKNNGFLGLIKLAFELRKERYSLIYDAHTNIRSFFLKLILLGPFFFISSKLVTRSKQRFKRFLLFNFRINKFTNWPFVAVDSFLNPLNLKKIDSTLSFPEFNKSFKENLLCLVLGANWDLKIWPESHWLELVNLYDGKVVLLGGTLEKEVADKVESKFADKIINYVGKTNLVESCYIISKSKAFISADTGLLHVADKLKLPGVCLMGPTAFGYPKSKTIKVLEDKSLNCRPCSKDGRGSCSQDVYKKCMVNLTPELVLKSLDEVLN